MLGQKPDMRHMYSIYLYTGECKHTAQISVVSEIGYEPNQNDGFRRDTV